jgi:hypothetical protein
MVRTMTALSAGASFSTTTFSQRPDRNRRTVPPETVQIVPLRYMSARQMASVLEPFLGIGDVHGVRDRATFHVEYV